MVVQKLALEASASQEEEIICPEQLKPGRSPIGAANFIIDWLSHALVQQTNIASITAPTDEARLAIHDALSVEGGTQGEWSLLRPRADLYKATAQRMATDNPYVTSAATLASLAEKIAHVRESALTRSKLDKYPQVSANLLLISRLVRMHDAASFSQLQERGRLTPSEALQFDQQLLAEIQLLLQPLFDILETRMIRDIDSILCARGVLGRLGHATISNFLNGIPKMEGTIESADDRFHYSEKLAPRGYTPSRQTAAQLTSRAEIHNGELFVDYCREIYQSFRS